MKSMFKGALSALVVVLALCGLTAASALAAGAPVVETKPATVITGTAASLNGVVNPNGVETKDYFEYGTTISYGSKSREQTTTVEKKPDIHVEGLLTHTTYHFRMVATNSFGTSYGADEVFSTPVEKPEFAVKAGQKLTEVAYTGGFGSADWDAAYDDFSCNTGEMSGVVTGSKTVQGKYKFIGCRQGKNECQSLGAKSEEIVTEELQGTLVYISKTAKTVGILFRALPGALVAKFACAYPFDREVRGGIIVPVNPVNTLKRGFTESELQHNAEGVQTIAEYENGSGVKVHSTLEAEWPRAETINPLAWGVPGFSVNTNKEIEIQA